MEQAPAMAQLMGNDNIGHDMALAELKAHIFNLPNQPDLIPLPEVLLQGDLGLLHVASAARSAGVSRWRIRGDD